VHEVGNQYIVNKGKYIYMYACINNIYNI